MSNKLVVFRCNMVHFSGFTTMASIIHAADIPGVISTVMRTQWRHELLGIDLDQHMCSSGGINNMKKNRIRIIPEDATAKVSSWICV